MKTKDKKQRIDEKIANRNFELVVSDRNDHQGWYEIIDVILKKDSNGSKDQAIESLFQSLPDPLLPYVSSLYPLLSQVLEQMGQLEKRISGMIRSERSFSDQLLMQMGLNRDFGTRISRVDNVSSILTKIGVKGIKTLLEQSRRFLSDQEPDPVEKLRTENQELREKIESKDILIKESNHRIKNHLQTLLGHMNLNLRNTNGRSNREILKKIKSSIESFKRFYQMIDFSSSDNEEFDINEYLSELVNQIIRSYDSEEFEKEMVINIDSNQFPSEYLMSIGLIINELVINSMEHGFDDHEKPKIMISLWEYDESGVLSVSDNGKGFELDTQDSNGSRGLNIVENITEKQLGGTLTREDPKNGTTWIIEFPLPPKS